MKEFDLISTYFVKQAISRKDVVVGIGDDAALLNVPETKHLAITTDTLVQGVHFPKSTPARAVGHKAVAVNLSDLAAMGAEPSWISLAITLPEIDKEWLADFSAGVFELCEYYQVQLIGGDVTQGPLAITITAQGMVPKGKQLLRSGAKGGDLIYVTGTLGDAAAGLDVELGNRSTPAHVATKLLDKLNYPRPQVLAGQALRDFANAAIDISDGFLADLQHICKASGVAAKVNVENIPLSLELREHVASSDALKYALTGGDDYQLIFTVSQDKKGGMETAMAHAGVNITCVGQIKANTSHQVALTLNNEPLLIDYAVGFEHFAS